MGPTITTREAALDALQSALANVDNQDEAKPPNAAWVERKVVCAKKLLRLCERIKRIDEGRPLLELVKDKNPARARASG